MSKMRQLIAAATGNSTGIHLHFGISIRNQGDKVNPHDYRPD